MDISPALREGEACQIPAEPPGNADVPVGFSAGATCQRGRLAGRQRPENRRIAKMTTDVSTETAPRFDSAAEVPHEYDIFCEACGYSLVGLSNDRCPECG